MKNIQIIRNVINDVKTTDYPGVGSISVTLENKSKRIAVSQLDNIAYEQFYGVVYLSNVKTLTPKYWKSLVYSLLETLYKKDTDGEYFDKARLDFEKALYDAIYLHTGITKIQLSQGK